MDTSSKTYILIDTSYFIFYRYYALIAWWKLAKPEDNLDIPFENTEFVGKFKKTFIDKINEIPKKLKIKNIMYICAIDCNRKNIWRMSNNITYKENRENDDRFLGGPFFKLAYEILQEINMPILFHDKLEGDDCIALLIKDIRSKYENIKKDYNIYIIASDMDYLQLVSENTHIINLKYKNLTDSKKWSVDPKKDLFCKIVIGDVSDNIPGIFKKCGIKTAIKYYEDEDLFKKKLHQENAEELFKKNKRLIDFQEIPQDLIDDYRVKNKDIISMIV